MFSFIVKICCIIKQNQTRVLDIFIGRQTTERKKKIKKRKETNGCQNEIKEVVILEFHLCIEMKLKNRDSEPVPGMELLLLRMESFQCKTVPFSVHIYQKRSTKFLFEKVKLISIINCMIF